MTGIVVDPLEVDEYGSDALNEQLVAWVRSQYPEEVFRRVLTQPYCELGNDDLGFLDVYLGASLLARPYMTVIDFGCYLAAQAALFQHCAAYIGVDVIAMERFACANTTHFVSEIRAFIDEHPELVGRDDVLAVCSYVPSDAARAAVNAAFLNVVNIYPSSGTRLRLPPKS